MPCMTASLPDGFQVACLKKPADTNTEQTHVYPRRNPIPARRKGIGKTVLQRLQQMGLDDVAKLAAANVDDMLQQGAALTGSTCWKNSPQARAAMQAAVSWAKRQQAAK